VGVKLLAAEDQAEVDQFWYLTDAYHFWKTRDILARELILKERRECTERLIVAGVLREGLPMPRRSSG
jgi:hypothetical protein